MTICDWDECALDGSHPANVASLCAPAPVALTDGPSLKSSHVVWREGRATAGDAVACFRGNGKICSFVSPSVRAGDDGENTDMVDRAALSLASAKQRPMHVKHQHLLSYPPLFHLVFNSPSRGCSSQRPTNANQLQ